MKNIPEGLLAHYQQGTTTLATCWKLTRQDNTVYGFTDHDSNLVFDGIEQIARTGFSPSAVENTNRLAVDNLMASGILDSEIITDKDLSSGKWDYAQIEIFFVNYENLTLGRDVLVKGRLGEVKIGRVAFEAEVRGMTNAYIQGRFLIYQPGCRADFGDSKCTVDTDGLKASGAIESVSLNNLVITDSSRTEETGYWNYGKIVMTSGDSVGLTMEIKSYSVGSIELQLDFAQGIKVGDTYEVFPGCGKRYEEDCIGRWNNGINFRGEPHLPGIDKVILFGGQK